MVNLVFVVLQSKSQVLNLGEVVLSCAFGSSLVFSSVIQKHLNYLIADASSVAESYWKPEIAPDFPATILPLYFIIFFWRSALGFTTADVELVRETCECDDGPIFTPLANALSVINSGNIGLSNGILERVRREKRDFRGRKLILGPSRGVYGTWVSVLIIF